MEVNEHGSQLMRGEGEGGVSLHPPRLTVAQKAAQRRNLVRSKYRWWDAR